MKKALPLLVFLTFAITTIFSQLPSNGYEFNFKIKGAKEEVVKLAYHKGENKLLVDSTQIDSKGNFTFAGDEQLPGGIYLIVFEDLPFFEFIINDDHFISFEADTSNLVKTMKIEGSKENEIFYEYLSFTTPKRKDVAQLSNEYREIKDSLPQKAENIKNKAITLNEVINNYVDSLMVATKGLFLSDILKAMQPIENTVPPMQHIADDKERQQARFQYYKEHFFDYIDLSDGRMVRTPILQPKLEQYIDKLVLQIPDSIIKEADKLVAATRDDHEAFKNMVVTITQKYEKSQIMCIDEVTYHMYKTYFLDSNRVTWISKETRDKIEKEVWKIHYNICGNTAFNLNLPDTSGTLHNLHSVDKEFTLVVFWSATCGHCKKAIPKLHDKYKNEWKDKYDIEVYSVHIDDNKKAYYDFLKKNKLSWINVNDPDDTGHYRQAYNIYSTPVYYLLDKDKKIIAKRIDNETTEKILEDHYSKEQ